MAKEHKFEDYTATTEDADGDKHESTVRAAVVTKDTAGREVVTRTGTHLAGKGEVLVETDRPGVYDVLTDDAWKSTGYGKPKSTSKSESSAPKKSAPAAKSSDSSAAGNSGR